MGFLDKIIPPGKMNIELEKQEYSPGEKVKGKIHFTTKHSVKARGAFVELSAVQTIRRRTSKGSSMQRETIFDFEKKLDGERGYTTGDYDFEIGIPRNILNSKAPQLEGNLGTAVNVVKALSGNAGMGEINWYVKAKLDIPGGRDISKTVEINVF